MVILREASVSVKNHFKSVALFLFGHHCHPVPSFLMYKNCVEVWKQCGTASIPVKNVVMTKAIMF